MNLKIHRKTALRALKIGIGSSIAIYVATLLRLDHAISAGTITLLTIVSTKWDTLKLSLFRIVTMAFTFAAAWLIFTHIGNDWIAYGIFIFLLVLLCDTLNLSATISVNAVIAAHFLMEMKFDGQFIMNEVTLVIIGITIAVILNLFNLNQNSKKELIKCMHRTEEQLQIILRELAQYLLNQEMPQNVWDKLCELERNIRQYVVDACEYQDNTFSSHPEYYINYFEMRLQQCGILHNLHYEMKKIRHIPVQAKIIAEYILYMADYVVEINYPLKQLERIHEIFDGMKLEPLPQTREEFESRAILYHILMDLEDFLVFKKRFVMGMDERQKKIYWR